MYKVIIIDDEPIIVEGLSRSIPWEKWNCMVAAAAYDGIEGTTAIREHHPNIIFSDIAMPGINGLGMVAALKSEYPDMEICILTGYRDFDYAQQAIRLGVTRFLLKPSNMSELEEAIEAMTATLKRKQIKSSYAEEDCGNSANSFIVKNALQYIKEHYSERITLAKVAEETYISQWHLSKLLNKQLNQSFSDILNSIRIEEAKELLKNPSLRIGTISDMIGFQDSTHFSRIFKKIMGVSANEYRNTQLR